MFIQGANMLIIFMLSVTINLLMLTVALLGVVMLSVVALKYGCTYPSL